MKPFSVLLLSFLCLLPAAQAQNAAAPPAYTITDLGSLGGPGSTAYGINDTGQVVGQTDVDAVFTHRAFLFSDGRLADLGSLGGGDSTATAINAAGFVVGSFSVDQTIGSRACLFAPDGTITDLGTLGGRYSFANALNDAGQIVGYAQRSAEPFNHAFLYDHGVMTDLGTLGGANSTASAINPAGQIVGNAESGSEPTHAFLYANGRMQDLGALASGSVSSAFGINRLGQVVGFSQARPSPNGRAFLYSSGRMADLGLDVYDATAFGINDSGQIVGTARVSFIGPAYAFLFSGGRAMDLNTLIDPAAGWQLTLARGINNRGQIVGSGLHQGQTRAFLLTPNRSPGAPAVTLAATVSRAFEVGRVRGEFTVSRAGAADLSAPLTVSYGVAGGALGGEHYQTLPGRVTIPAGRASKIIKVKPLDHGGVPGTKTLKLTLQPDAAYTVPEPVVTAKVKIVGGR